MVTDLWRRIKHDGPDQHYPSFSLHFLHFLLHFDFLPSIREQSKLFLPCHPNPGLILPLVRTTRDSFSAGMVFFQQGWSSCPRFIFVCQHIVWQMKTSQENIFMPCATSRFSYWAPISWAGAVFGRAGRQPRGEQHGLRGLLQHWTPDRDNRRLWKMALVWGAVRSTWQLLHNSAPRARRSHMESNIYSEPCTIKHLWAFKRR